MCKSFISMNHTIDRDIELSNDSFKQKLLNLLVVLFLLIVVVVDLEVSQLVAVLGVGNHTKPVPQVVFLQVLLGEVLKVALGEGGGRGDGNLVLLPNEGDLLAEVVGFATYLDPLAQVLLEVLAVHDAVLDRVGAVDGELEGQLVLLAASLALQLLLAGTLLGAGGLLGYGSHFCFLGGRVSTVTQHFR